MSQSKRLDNPYELALRDFALTYPGTHEDFPWGDRALKVKGKVFLFVGSQDGGLGLSVKLPHSNAAALMMPFATPTGYGLGKSGWVSATFPKGQQPPMEMLRQWVDESYRAVAPKKLVAQIGASSAPEAKRVAAPRKAAAAKKAVARKQTGARAKQAR